MISSGYWSQCRQSEVTHVWSPVGVFFFHRMQTNPNPVTFSNGLFSIFTTAAHVALISFTARPCKLWLSQASNSFQSSNNVHKIIHFRPSSESNTIFRRRSTLEEHKHSDVCTSAKEKGRRWNLKNYPLLISSILLIALQCGSHSLQKAADFSSWQWRSHPSWLHIHAGVSSFRLCVSFNKDAAL